MKKRNMLTKVAALSMAGLMTLTGLPVAGLDGALKTEAAAAGTYAIAVGGVESTATEMEVGQVNTISVNSGAQIGIDNYDFNVTSNTITVVTGSGVSKGHGSKQVSVTTGASVEVRAVSAGTSAITASQGSAELTGASNTITVKKVPIDSTSQSVNVVLKRAVSGDPTSFKEFTVTSNNSSIDSKEYDGIEYVWSLESVTVGDAKVNVKNDFDLYVGSTPAANKGIKEVDTYSLILQQKASTTAATGKWNISYAITSRSMSDAKVVISGSAATQVYNVNGAVISDGDVSVVLDGKTVPASEYALSFSNNTGVSTNNAVVTATANNGSSLTGSQTANYGITAKSLGDGTNEQGVAMIGTIGNQAYTGSAIVPDVRLYDTTPLDKDNSAYESAYIPNSDNKDVRYRELVPGTDFTVSAKDNVKEGSTATVTIKGINNYTGSFTKTFFITEGKKNIANYAEMSMKVSVNGKMIDLANGGDVTFTGSYITPTVTVKYTDPETGAVTNITSSTTAAAPEFENNKNVGTATVKVKGTGAYGGELSQTFTIKQKDISDDVTVSLSKTSETYTGGKITPSISSVKYGNIPMNEGDDYAIYYDNNINAGTATVTIAGKGNYTGATSADFAINPASANLIDIEAIANQVYTGEAIEPGVDAKFTLPDGTKQALTEGEDYTLTYTNNIGNETSTSATTANITVNGIGNFQSTKSVTFNIVPTANDLSKAVVTLTYDTVEYDGDYHTAGIKNVKFDDVAIAASKYTLVKKVSEVNAGEYEVQVKGAQGSEYGGIGTAKFTITPKAATVDFKLSATKKTYNGKAQTVEVKDVTRDEAAIDESEYEVTGTTKATKAGTKKVTVTLKGNYAGTATKTWTIAKAKQTLKVSPASKSFKVKAVKKKAQSFTIKATKAQGKVTYKSSSKKVKVSSKGKVTVKKGTKKGTYKITVKAAGNANYNAGSKTVTVKVK